MFDRVETNQDTDEVIKARTIYYLYTSILFSFSQIYSTRYKDIVGSAKVLDRPLTSIMITTISQVQVGR